MVTRKKPDQLTTDAQEFGRAVRCGGWRLGLLVARNVAPAKAGRPAAENASLEMDSAKVSMTKFAEIAGVSQSHVSYYYKAWELAAKAGLVPSAQSVDPGEENIDVETDSIEDDENPRTQWSWFYSLAKNPPKQEKPVEPKQDSKSESETTETDKNDNSDSELDEDFGLNESVTSEQVAEADSSVQRNELLEILESLRSAVSKMEAVGSVKTTNESIVNQISSTAMDLSTTARSLTEIDCGMV